MVARDNGEIVFDTESGISVEEQKNIVRQIENATRSEGGAEAVFRRIQAGKKGFVFPLLVNVAAVALVFLGALLFVLFRDSPGTRRLNVVGTLDSAEGKLIQEIRRQSAEQVGEKELEIAGVTDKIAGLVEERENISAQIKMQPAREAELLPKIDALDVELGRLRQALEQLQFERRQLVVISRSQEAEVFSRRAGGEATEAAMEELRKLNTEDERYAFFERQVAGAGRKNRRGTARNRGTARLY